MPPQEDLSNYLAKVASKTTEKYTIPSCSNGVVRIILKDLFVKPFLIGAKFQIPCSEVKYQNSYKVAIR